MKNPLIGTKLYSMLWMKCPRCHSHDLFETPTYSFRNFFGMPDNCPKCGQKFSLEVGFYFGAMYVSYGVCVAYGVALFVALTVLYPSFSLHFYMISLLITLIMLWPAIFRFSRAIWINFFVDYDKNAITKHQELK
jgi:uncharacterized protein (DUF983 family)